MKIDWSEMAAEEIELPVRKARASRRRPDLEPPKVKKIKPRSGLSRAEVIADQRRRILDGLAVALAYHGYEDTKITDIVELAAVSRPTFYEHFESKDDCFAAAYEDGVERLSEEVGAAVRRGRDRPTRISAGLRAALAFLAASPPWAHLLLVESLAASRPARLEHERSLVRLAQALRFARTAGSSSPDETARLLAGGLVSLLSGRVLAGEAERLPESHDLLLDYLLAPSLPATSRVAGERRA
jgi:AcrR family transcriptional regulator